MRDTVLRIFIGMSSRLPTEPRPRITRRPFPVALLLVLTAIVAAGVGAGYGISRAVKSRQAWIARAVAASAGMLERMEDLVARHPDFDEPAAAAEVRAFLSMPAARRARDLARGETALSSLRQAYRALAGAPTPDGYKTFSPNGFRLFYDELEQPETGRAVRGAAITSLPAADERITEIATRRGYRLRPIADEDVLVTVGDNRTHRSALAGFRALQQAAREAGIEIGLVSGYRSINHQRSIFVGRLTEAAMELRGRDVRMEEIARGEADDVVDKVLQTSAIPGYSKHHTGYAMDWVDITSGIVFTDFDQTPAHRWLAKDNYANAKRFGFLPSYPPGASEQGPDPETWEYVWVGGSLLKEDW